MIVEGRQEDVTAAIQKMADEKISQGYAVGIIGTDETAGAYRSGLYQEYRGTRR